MLLKIQAMNRKLSFLLCTCGLLSMNQVLAQKNRHYPITSFGAVLDSSILNTQAIQTTIETASKNGGGVVVVPRGTFLSGALFFPPGTSLLLEEGAVLKGSDDIRHYPLLPSRMEGQNLEYFAALINAEKVDSFAIQGKGGIDGNGLRFWKQFWSHVDSMQTAGKAWTNLEVHRPRLIFVSHSRHVRIEGVKLRNSGFWTTHLYKCEDVQIENVDIRSPFQPVKAPSTDAIDLDACSLVVIRNSYFSVNDDAIAIKGGKGPYADQQPENGKVENVLIEHCTFGRSHAAVTFGSECIHAKNIVIRHCKIEADMPLLWLKLRPDTPQLYEDITVEDVTGNCQSIISAKPWTQFNDLKGRKDPPKALVRNILIKDLNVACKRIGELKGNPNDIAQNILFKDCRFSTTEKEAFTTSFDKAVTFENVRVNGIPFKQ